MVMNSLRDHRSALLAVAAMILAAALAGLSLDLAWQAAAAAAIAVTLAVAFAAGYRYATRSRLGGLSEGFWREQRERARRLSIHADVPWLFNRWYFDFRLSEEIERGRRYDFQLAVLLIRLEGSPAALEMLGAKLVQDLSVGLRPFDIPARLSDSEYVVCMIQCDQAGAEAAARRLNIEHEFEARVAVAVFPEEEPSRTRSTASPSSGWQRQWSLPLPSRLQHKALHEALLDWPPRRRSRSRGWSVLTARRRTVRMCSAHAEMSGGASRKGL